MYIVSAPSGAGKTTLCKQIVTSISGVWHSISATTRKPRPGEEHGREYFFLEEQAFHDMVTRDEFLEYAHVYSHWYGTPRGPLMDKIQQGVDVLLEIDVQGALQIKKQFVDAVSIFILPPSMEILRARLQGRASDSEEEILRRLRKVKDEVWCVREYSYIVRNDDLGQSLRELQSIFHAERLKTHRMNMQWLERSFVAETDATPNG
ncbi:MAG: guanylate kinase [Nitrospira sp. HN-bin3]|uniref:guanylate kinase n=1 Tax=Nitrospira cf. moscoviensis SBR1015 TaxID=96242 RepID=UPI000A0C43BF|nr:guanylate kinase [Nitrospira cf. moscoviensis SBR1015]MBH0209021.1 guanylate kinase [Nitrospira sp.]OQW35703.1 MAG: guanylate kinase [Nitrospira sp. HN-bin3]